MCGLYHDPERVTSRSLSLPCPRFGDCTTLFDVVNDEDQLVIVITVEYLNVYARLGHPSSELPELARFRLIKSLDQYFPFFHNSDACCFERPSSGGSILEEKVGHTLMVNNEGASAFDANPSAAEGVAHFGQCTGTIFQRDC
jgi:hypothetical protein